MATALRRTVFAAVLLSVGMLAGCGRSAMTTDEFFAQQTGKAETIEVDRPLRDVAATFRDRAPACIQDVQTTSINGSANRRLMTRWLYHETVVATDKQVELIVQVTTPAVVHMYEQPEHGIYALIARAVPIDGRRSRIEIYGSWGSLWEEGTLKTAVRGWAVGTFAGCPELP
jgi:hypothetical protein